MGGPGLERGPRFFIRRRHAHVDCATGPLTDLREQVGVTDDHGPLGNDADRRSGRKERLERSSRELVVAFDRLVRIGRRANRDQIALPRGLVELAPQDFGEIRFHENQ